MRNGINRFILCRRRLAHGFIHRMDGNGQIIAIIASALHRFITGWVKTITVPAVIDEQAYEIGADVVESKRYVAAADYVLRHIRHLSAKISLNAPQRYIISNMRSRPLPHIDHFIVEGPACADRH